MREGFENGCRSLEKLCGKALKAARASELKESGGVQACDLAELFSVVSYVSPVNAIHVS